MHLIKCSPGLCHRKDFVLVIITIMSNDVELASSRARGEIISIYQEYIKVSVH